jgi:lipopolysaccharide export LptBFGC system permease protein LptF
LALNYAKIFFLSLVGFIGTLFVMRFREIAEFASLNSHPGRVVFFSLLQIPYILPYAIAISSLIASIVLFHRMSESQELTTLRASGISLYAILHPLLLIGTLLSLTSFTIVSEIAPKCRLLSKQLTYDITTSNPFSLFYKIAAGKLSNAYVDMRTLKGGTKANDLLLVVNHPSSGRLGIITAKEIETVQDHLIGKEVTVLTSVDSKMRDNFDHLILEHQTLMSTKSAHLTQLLQDNDWHLGLDYLGNRAILAKTLPKKRSLVHSAAGLELARRFSISLAPFLFTLMGTTLGIDIGRRRSRRGLILAILGAAFYLICFIGAKSIRHQTGVAYLTYFIAVPVVVGISIAFFRKISRGADT